MADMRCTHDGWHGACNHIRDAATQRVQCIKRGALHNVFVLLPNWLMVLYVALVPL